MIACCRLSAERDTTSLPEKLLEITRLLRERIRLLQEVFTVGDFFFVDQLPAYDPAELIPQKGDQAMALKALTKAREVLPSVEFKHDPLDQSLRAAAQELGLKAGQMFQPIRVAVCGKKNAPPLFETLEVLGKEKTLERIGQAIEKLSNKLLALADRQSRFCQTNVPRLWRLPQMFRGPKTRANPLRRSRATRPLPDYSARQSRHKSLPLRRQHSAD